MIRYCEYQPFSANPRQPRQVFHLKFTSNKAAQADVSIDGPRPVAVIESEKVHASVVGSHGAGLRR